MSEVQAIAFYKDGWTAKKADKWLKKNGYSPMKELHETKNMLHYRINNPAKYKGFSSKIIDSRKGQILLTIGLAKNKEMCGEGLSNAEYSELKTPSIDFQEVYPLSKESSILDHPVIDMKDFDRGSSNDKVTVQDLGYLHQDGERPIEPYMRENTLLGYMMRPKNKGGVGFPFPTSASIYSPMDWLSMSMFK